MALKSRIQSLKSVVKKVQIKRTKRHEYFRKGRNTKQVDEYSEGEENSEFTVPFRLLKKPRKTYRVLFLWRKAYKRALMGAKMVRFWFDRYKRLINEGGKMHLLGLKKNRISESGELKIENAIPTWILTPENKFK